MKHRNKKQYYTKHEVKTILSLWDTSTKETIAAQLKRSEASIGYLANAIRKAGYPLPRKRKTGTTQAMVKDVLKELGLLELNQEHPTSRSQRGATR